MALKEDIQEAFKTSIAGNGDVSEDKELEDQDDPRDNIVDDNGFVNSFKRKGDVAQVSRPSLA